MAKDSYQYPVKVKLSSLDSKEEEKKKQKPMHNGGRGGDPVSRFGNS